MEQPKVGIVKGVGHSIPVLQGCLSFVFCLQGMLLSIFRLTSASLTSDFVFFLTKKKKKKNKKYPENWGCSGTLGCA